LFCVVNVTVSFSPRLESLAAAYICVAIKQILNFAENIVVDGSCFNVKVYSEWFEDKEWEARESRDNISYIKGLG